MDNTPKQSVYKTFLSSYSGWVKDFNDLTPETSFQNIDTTLFPSDKNHESTTSIGLDSLLPHIASFVHNVTDDLNNSHNNELLSLTEEISKLSEKIEKIETSINNYDSHTIIKSTISTLPSEEYSLLQPIDIILKIYEDEVIALIPELEIYGEGETEMEAVKDLKLEILDLYDDMNEMDDDELGEDPKMWKKAINKLVEQCQ